MGGATTAGMPEHLATRLWHALAASRAPVTAARDRESADFYRHAAENN